jgi:hypothetical protein
MNKNKKTKDTKKNNKTNDKDYPLSILNLKKDLLINIELSSMIKDNSNKMIDIVSKKLEMNKDIKYSNTYVIDKSPSNTKNFYLDYAYLHQILQKYGLKKSDNPKMHHLFGIIGNKFYETNFYLLNNFENIDSFRDKYNLYFNLKTSFPLYYYKNYPDSFMLSTNLEWKNLPNNKIYIARPISGEAGDDIFIINNENTLEYVKKILVSKYYKLGISLTEYVTNPMLFKKKKMHLRAYMLFTLIDNTFKSYLLEYGELFTAKEDYKNEDWNNKNIHDTHSKSTIQKDLLFPDAFYGNTTPEINEKDYDKIYANACECIEKISKIAASHIYNYNNTINTYEVYGIDILVRDDLSVFIMEINAQHVGYKGCPDELLKKYFCWIEECVIKPCLFPNLEIEKSKSTKPIYEITIEDY